MAISKSQAGLLSDEDKRLLEVLESAIDRYLDDNWDPKNPKPVLVPNYVLRRARENAGFSGVGDKVQKNLLGLYTDPNNGWKVTPQSDGYKFE